MNKTKTYKNICNEKNNGVSKKLILNSFFSMILKFSLAAALKNLFFRAQKCIIISLALFVLTAIFVIAGDVVIESGKLDVSGNLYVDGAGNVGVGTTTPTEKLTVNGNFSVGSKLVVNTAGNVGIGTTVPRELLEINTPSGAVGIEFREGGTPRGQIGIEDGSENYASGTEDNELVVNSFGSLGFGTVSNERMRIDRSGNVGIGNAGPATLLHLTGLSPEIRMNDSSRGGRIGLKTNSVANTDFDIQQNGTSRVYINPSGNVGIGTTGPKVKLHLFDGAGGGSAPSPDSDILTIENDGINYLNLIAPTNSYAGVIFSDSSRAVGGISYDFSNDRLRFSVGGGTLAAVISSNGNMGIGTTTPDVKLDVDGDIEGDLLSTGSTGYVGYVSGGSNGGIYKLVRYSSSKRYKENISDFKKGLEVIEKLRPVEFNWKTTKERDFGFIAEEAEEIDPMLIVRMNGEVENFKYMQLTAILTNAIKELKKENEELKERVSVLEKAPH